jgi:hypothetical protein
MVVGLKSLGSSWKTVSSALRVGFFSARDWQPLILISEKRLTNKKKNFISIRPYNLFFVPEFSLK